jgi:hypothetical protein
MLEVRSRILNRFEPVKIQYEIFNVLNTLEIEKAAIGCLLNFIQYKVY